MSSSLGRYSPLLRSTGPTWDLQEVQEQLRQRGGDGTRKAQTRQGAPQARDGAVVRQASRLAMPGEHGELPRGWPVAAVAGIDPNCNTLPDVLSTRISSNYCWFRNFLCSSFRTSSLQKKNFAEAIEHGF